VAKLAKVSRGSLLHQFPTKVDLIIGWRICLRSPRRKVREH